MLSIKQVFSSGREVTFEARRVEFHPACSGDAAYIDGQDSSDFGGSYFRIDEECKVFIMNENGQTISKHILQNNSTEKHA